MHLLEKKIVQGLLPKRQAYSHKGDYGRVLLIGGNEQMGGAIILAASATVASGAGLVTVATHSCNHAALHARLPEAMVLDIKDQAQLMAALQATDVVVVGPGLGRTGADLLLLSTICSSLTAEQSLIIDGDAITLLAENPLPQSKAFTVYTPHEKEWERLSGLPIDKQTVKNNQASQEQLNSVIVLKKHLTEIYFPQDVWQNQSGTAAMATGGMGDTLAGMLGGFLAQMHNKKSAILAAVFLHSHISDLIAETSYVTLPSEIIKRIPKAMKEFESTLEVVL
ncbi:NAD(P)H-hydrate dehydratase [Isobaculum melis]|uniref:ADP-dependent (S)-NAD(P)H-hydrate dehydratase n=1 Tax=Isobaculum melis TaxID=142588 RepID=A0A1H9Q048_9LACT|nr:NAD(P)H-hydrate dehydratase [Isobaculum melis]SER53379.1 yjeF C-terminal region, hydroxyethylthiazole kinase-related [Isobaculum melis]